MDSSKRIETHWEVRTYDVWGNRDDGYDVNDVFSLSEDTRIDCKVQTHNAGTPQQFDSATPSDGQIRKVFGVSCKIETDGDDTRITVDRASDGYPIGELTCISHESLSPIRAISEVLA